MLLHRFNRGLPTESAARSGKNVAGQSREIHLYRRRKKYIQRVLRSSAFEAGRDFHNVGTVMDDAFGEQKTRRQLLIVAGCSHGHRDAMAAHANFQRFLHREFIGLPPRFALEVILEDVSGYACTRSLLRYFGLDSLRHKPPILKLNQVLWPSASPLSPARCNPAHRRWDPSPRAG